MNEIIYRVLLILALVLFIGAMVTIIGGVSWAIKDGMIGAVCLKKGYPRSDSVLDPDTFEIVGYCIREENETEVVRPLKELE